MTTAKKSKKELLRQKAEKLLSKKSPIFRTIENRDIKKLVHELQVHQIELEMQNDELRKAQEEIEESRTKYSDLYDFAPVGYFTFSRTGEIAEANLTAATLLGIDRTKLLRREFSTFVDPGFRSLFRDHRLSVLESGRKERCELKLIKKDGKSFYASLESIPVREKGRGIGLRIRSAISDITELKKAQEKAETEHAFRIAVANSILSGIIALDPKGRQSYVNLGFCRMVGRSEEELIGRKPPFAYWPPEESDHISRAFQNMMDGKSPRDGLELRFMRKNGERFDALVLSSPLKDHGGRIIGLIATVGDISHIKQMEKDLKQLNTQLEERVHQRTAELENANEQLKKEITERERMEEELRKSRGELEVRVQERTSELMEVVEELQDEISERKQTEEALRAAHLYNRSLIEASLDPLVTINADGKVTDVNRATEIVTGLTRDRLIGSDFSDYFTEPDRARRGYMQVFLSGSVKDYPLVVRHTSGQVTDVLYNATVYKNEIGEIQGVFAAARDITERKRAEEALRESETRLRYLSSQLLTVQEDERKHIAREVHDSLGQSLSAIKFKVESVITDERQSGHKQLVKSLETIVPIIQTSLEEARRIQMDLRPSVLDDLGIVPTLEWFCRDYQEIYSHIRIEKETHIEESDLSPELKTVIYRVTQEAMNNIAKHSKANLVRLSLNKNENKIELTIRDNGIGFDLEQVIDREESKRGLGLTSMRERIQLSGGSCMIESSPGQGTTLTAIWTL